MAEEEIEFDQDLAQRLLLEGGTLVFLNVPHGTDLGIDLKSWNTGENFRGIKMIPPGFHYVHYSAVNEIGEMAPRSGFLHVFNTKEFLVKQWDKKEEDVSSEVISDEVTQRLKTNLKELDRCLGAYPYSKWKEWKSLTNHITPTIVDRCSPICGYVRSALELEHCSDANRPRGGVSLERARKKSRLTDEDKEEQLLPELHPKPGTEIRFTKIPDKHYPDNATPNEITKHSLDSSFMLNTLLKTLALPMEIIGELQLAFVCFLVGQSFEAFEHWKKLITLICGADAAIPDRRPIYFEFLKTIETQLKYVPEDMLCDIVANNNFVYQNLRKLFANIQVNEEVDGRIKTYVVRLKDRLSEKFLWDFSHLQEEAEDEAPVIVSLE